MLLIFALAILACIILYASALFLGVGIIKFLSYCDREYQRQHVAFLVEQMRQEKEQLK